MTAFEKIVRPFQLRDTSPPRPVPLASISTGNAEPVILKWGETGSTRTFHGSFSSTQTYYAIRRPKEKVTTGA